MKTKTGIDLELVDMGTEEGGTVMIHPKMYEAIESADVILVDHVLPDGDSLAFLSAVRKVDPRVPVIVITGFGTVDLAVRALRQGAHDVLTEPLPMSAVLASVRSALEARPPDLSARRGLDTLVGESEAMIALRRDVAVMAEADCPVLILGETGSGIGVVARALHDVGLRSRGPFSAAGGNRSHNRRNVWPLNGWITLASWWNLSYRYLFFH